MLSAFLHKHSWLLHVDFHVEFVTQECYCHLHLMHFQAHSRPNCENNSNDVEFGHGFKCSITLFNCFFKFLGSPTIAMFVCILFWSCGMWVIHCSCFIATLWWWRCFGCGFPTGVRFWCLSTTSGFCGQNVGLCFLLHVGIVFVLLQNVTACF